MRLIRDLRFGRDPGRRLARFRDGDPILTWSVAPDQEGSDFVDLAAARQTAFIGIRSLPSAEVMDSEINLKGHLDIVDDQGVVLDRITFAEVLNIVGS
jgi:hypothetical protein